MVFITRLIKNEIERTMKSFRRLVPTRNINITCLSRQPLVKPWSRHNRRQRKIV
uniref:Uncharacterized protein n=1 Tax=Meloidogyne enterolobii TaxID=390850 RepID=A0A6V7VJV4_MELEN|nr:unnamed protein product [Meloidogyne enterolobii]